MLETRERASTKECLTQSKILELVSQLSRTTSEIDLLQCSKEEVNALINSWLKFSVENCQYVYYLCIYNAQAERRYHSQLQDMKNRLEQSDRTNQSLQNYVHFLKVLYSNVCGDVP